MGQVKSRSAKFSLVCLLSLVISFPGLAVGQDSQCTAPSLPPAPGPVSHATGSTEATSLLFANVMSSSRQSTSEAFPIKEIDFEKGKSCRDVRVTFQGDLTLMQNYRVEAQYSYQGPTREAILEYVEAYKDYISCSVEEELADKCETLDIGEHAKSLKTLCRSYCRWQSNDHNAEDPLICHSAETELTTENCSMDEPVQDTLTGAWRYNTGTFILNANLHADGQFDVVLDCTCIRVPVTGRPPQDANRRSEEEQKESAPVTYQ